MARLKSSQIYPPTGTIEGEQAKMFAKRLVQLQDEVNRKIALSQKNVVTNTAVVSGGITGNLTGNVTGDVTGNVTGDVTGGLTGSSASNIIMNTDKFTVAGETGNTAVGGTLDVVGNIDPTSFETTNGGFLDEDDMASDSDVAVASQQSIKAYVDAAGGGFVDRGDPTGFDWDQTDLSVQNDTWNDLDLSAIVPAGAKLVLFRTLIKDASVNVVVYLREKGNVDAYNATDTRTQVSNVYLAGEALVACGSDRVVEYRITAAIDYLGFLVKGWWL